jgi:hypothetical protein
MIIKLKMRSKLQKLRTQRTTNLRKIKTERLQQERERNGDVEKLLINGRYPFQNSLLIPPTSMQLKKHTTNGDLRATDFWSKRGVKKGLFGKKLKDIALQNVDFVNFKDIHKKFAHLANKQVGIEHVDYQLAKNKKKFIQTQLANNRSQMNFYRKKAGQLYTLKSKDF